MLSKGGGAEMKWKKAEIVRRAGYVPNVSYKISAKSKIKKQIL
jgi:hypothetical protein